MSLADPFRRHILHALAGSAVAVEGLGLAAPARAAQRDRAAAGAINVRDFGAVGDGIADDRPAFLRAIESVRANATGARGETRYVGGPRVHVPPGTYFLSDTIDLKRTVIIEGDTGGLAGGQATILRFAADRHGFIIERNDTIGGVAVEERATGGADGTILRNLALQSMGGSVGHGIWAKARFVAEDVHIAGFPQNGIRVHASAKGTGATRGNANNFHIVRGRIADCGGDGLFVDGPDANAGLILGLGVSGNGGWGIFDSSFLGNTYVGCHAANNARSARRPAAVVSHKKQRWFVVAGQREAASTTEPGTDPKVWGWLRAGGPSRNIAAWKPGMALVEGGAYRTDNPNARNVFLGCYSESGQGPSQFARRTLALGGLHAAGIVGSGVFIDNHHGLARTDAGFTARSAEEGGSYAATLGGDTAAGEWLSLEDAGLTGDILRLRLGDDRKDVIGDFGNKDAARFLTITGPATAQTFGRAEPVPHAFAVSRLGLGGGRSARLQSYADAPPAAGSYAKGDVLWNSGRDGAHDRVDYWRCVEGGSPGRWVARP